MCVFVCMCGVIHGLDDDLGAGGFHSCTSCKYFGPRVVAATAVLTKRNIIITYCDAVHSYISCAPATDATRWLHVNSWSTLRVSCTAPASAHAVNLNISKRRIFIVSAKILQRRFMYDRLLNKKKKKNAHTHSYNHFILPHVSVICELCAVQGNLCNINVCYSVGRGWKEKKIIYICNFRIRACTYVIFLSDFVFAFVQVLLFSYGYTPQWWIDRVDVAVATSVRGESITRTQRDNNAVAAGCE